MRTKLLIVRSRKFHFIHRGKGDIEAVYIKIKYRTKSQGTKDTLIICFYALFVHIQIYHRVPAS